MTLALILIGLTLSLLWIWAKLPRCHDYSCHLAFDGDCWQLVIDGGATGKYPTKCDAIRAASRNGFDIKPNN
jgi:hypothetical protein